MVAQVTGEAYEANVRSLISAVDLRGRRDARDTEREDSLSSYLIGTLAWQEEARRRALREQGVYSVEAAVTSAFHDLWSLSERLAKINDDEESETGKQLHMDMVNLADLEWAYQSIPSLKLRMVWDWCVIGRERRLFAAEYRFVYFVEMMPAVMVKGKQRPRYRCQRKSPAGAARMLRARDIPASAADVEGMIVYATAVVVTTLCHEGVLLADGSRP